MQLEIYSIEECSIFHKDTTQVLGEWCNTEKKYTYGNETHIRLPAATKTKLVRQVLVQKGRVLFRWHDLENGRLPSKRPSPFPAQACSSYRNREGRAFFSLSIHLPSFWHIGAFPFIYLSLWPAGALPVHLSSVWPLSVRTSSCCHLGQLGRLPCTPADCGKKRTLRGGVRTQGRATKDLTIISQKQTGCFNF